MLACREREFFLFIERKYSFTFPTQFNGVQVNQVLWNSSLSDCLTSEPSNCIDKLQKKYNNFVIKIFDSLQKFKNSPNASQLFSSVYKRWARCWANMIPRDYWGCTWKRYEPHSCHCTLQQIHMPSSAPSAFFKWLNVKNHYELMLLLLLLFSATSVFYVDAIVIFDILLFCLVLFCC